MQFLNNIQSVAKYESKILIRSWFFKIFMVLALFFLGIFMGVMLLGGDNSGSWKYKAIASNAPYAALLLLNTGQAIIAIFLSSEFLKRDKKLDTSEVFYVHPLSNASYVFGKIWGNLRVFLLLNLVVLGMILLFNILSPETAVDGYAYLLYMLIISIPTLIFIIGLSILLMLLIKNQALTFVILLGYIGLTLFYIGDKFYYLFDYMAYSLPLVKSSIVGFSNWETILNHRGMYLFAGLACICFTISLFNRLPNSSRSSYPWIVIGVLLLGTTGACGYRHVHSFIQDGKMREAYIAINNEYVHSPKMVIGQYDISLEQQPDQIVADVTMTGQPLQTSPVFTFCLNPGLQVDEVTHKGQPISFTREQQLLLIDFGKPVTPSDTLSFHVRYSGRIDNNFCYLDIPDEILRKTHTRDMFNVDKKYCFQTSDYLLFTPENYWYPIPGTSFSDKSPDWRQSYFSKFTLQITPLPGLTAVTQPEYISSPAIPLIIGNYKQVSMQSDSTTYSAWYIDGHDYFIAPYDSIRDTIPTLVREIRESLERTYKLSYPFDHFSVVEVPAQFYSYTRSWSQAQETVQPGMVLFPEKGWIFDYMDINRRTNQHIRWARNNGQEINEKEARQRTFNDFLRTFTRMEGDRNFSSVGRGNIELTTQQNPYFLFPQLYNFRYNIFSPEWPVANRIIELYLQNRVVNDDWERNINGLSNNEKANQLMGDYSFKELLSNVEHRDIMDNIVGLRGSHLFAFAEYNIGVTAFRDSLYALLDRNTFRNIQFEHLLDTLGMISGADITSQIAGWDQPTSLPYYIIDLPEATRYTNRGQEIFLLKLNISNNSDADGIVNVRTQVGGRSVENDDPRLNRQIPLAAHQSKQLVTIWDDAPRDIVVSTLISQNLPNKISLPIRNINREAGRPTEAEGDYTLPESTFSLPGEIIVDNEDSLLFSLSKPGIVGLLPQWLDKVEDTSFKYKGIPGWRPPLRWTATTRAGYYGQYVRSAYVIKSGDGSQTATWNVPLPSSGHYEVYYWIFRGDGRNNRQNNSEFHFKVRYDDEEEDAYISMRRTEDGWNLLGTYYVDSDTIQVVLSNDSKQWVVTADAVRVVKR